MGKGYVINENGEILRGDYFATSVKEEKPQPLPCNRKAWVMFLLNVVTLGIYAVIIWFAMGKETNISCSNDGKHTKGFWATLGLSIITLGIYFIVWVIQWMKRETDFLRDRKESAIITGGAYILLTIVNVIITYVLAFNELPIAQIIVNYAISFALLFFVIKKHNRVNEIYNLEHFPENMKEVKKG